MFAECSFFKVMEIVKTGQILAKPDACPEEIYVNLILRCCAQKPAERHTATSAKNELEKLLEGALLYCPIVDERKMSVFSLGRRESMTPNKSENWWNISI